MFQTYFSQVLICLLILLFRGVKCSQLFPTFDRCFWCGAWFWSVFVLNSGLNPACPYSGHPRWVVASCYAAVSAQVDTFSLLIRQCPESSEPQVLGEKKERKKWKQIQKHTALKAAKFRLPPTSKEIHSRASNNSQKKIKSLPLKTIQLLSLKFICFSSFHAVWSRASQPTVCEHPCLQTLPWGSWLLQREESLDSEVRFRKARSSLPVSPSPCQKGTWQFQGRCQDWKLVERTGKIQKTSSPPAFKRKKK